MSTREIPAEFDPARHEGSRFVDVSDMFAIAQRVLREFTDDRYDADVLMQVTRLDDDPRNLRARYELRHKELRFSERNTQGKLSLRMFEGTFRLVLANAWKELQDEQPNAGWVPVAAVLSERSTGRSEAVETAKQADGSTLQALYASSVAMLDPGKPNRIGSVKEFRVVPDVQMIASIAFADLAQGELEDPIERHDDGKESGGSFAKYVKTRNLRHLPPGLRKRRKLAEAVILRYYADAPRDPDDAIARPPVTPPEQIQRVAFTDEQLKAGLEARNSGKTWREVAEAMGSDDERKARAAVLRYAERIANPGSGVDPSGITYGPGEQGAGA